MPENKVRHLKLTLEYDGAAFNGFQAQPGKPTVQKALERAFKSTFRKKTKMTSASSRTDAGVHAEDQIVCVATDCPLPLYRIERSLNFFLPESVAVTKIEEVSKDFHARFHAKSKIYEYRIWNGSVRPALQRHLVHHIPVKLDLAAMKKAAKFLIGKHDFRALTSEKSIAKGKTIPQNEISFVRTIKKCALTQKGSLITLTVEADGFLYHMVRNIAGLLCDVGRGKIQPENVKKVLLSRDRRASGATLPALGLTLKRVIY